MSDRGEPQTSVWLRPAAVWAALTLLALTSIGIAYLYPDPIATVLNLVTAGIMVMLLWVLLMDLVSAVTLVRLIAVAGLLWLSFMFALIFSDYFFRTCETPSRGTLRSCVPNNAQWRTF